MTRRNLFQIIVAAFFTPRKLKPPTGAEIILQSINEAEKDMIKYFNIYIFSSSIPPFLDTPS